MTRTIRHILCVDDHEDTCEMLKVLLSDHKVTAVGTCAEALRKAKSRLIDLYLLDNWLPYGSGIDLCKEIQEIDPNTPIVFYSAAALKSDRDEARKAGASEIARKPLDIDSLLNLIKQQL